MIPSLKALVVGEKDEALGIVVELLGGLHDNGELLVDAVEGLIAEGVDLLDVRRDILVRPLEPGKNGSGKGLVSGVAELDRPLSVFVGLESVDAVANDGVVEEMLSRLHVSREVGACDATRSMTHTWMNAECAALTSPLT